jgi:transcriptional regulator with XRE-family HTH domain
MPKKKRKYDKKFGPFIKRQREKKYPDMSMSKFARDVIEITPTYLWNIENKKSPPPSEKVTLRIAEALDISPDKLLSMAGHIDPSLSLMILDMPAEARQIITLLDHVLKESETGLSLIDLTALLLENLIERDGNVSLGDVMRYIAEITDAIDGSEDKSLPVEFEEKKDKGMDLFWKMVDEAKAANKQKNGGD